MEEESRKKINYLNQYYYAKRNEILLKEEINNLRMDKSYPSSVAVDGMPHAHGFSDLSEYAAEIDRLIHDLKLQRYTCIKIYSEIKHCILRTDGVYQEVLTRRYIFCQKWEKIAIEMGYSYPGIQKLHKRALKKIKSI